MYAARYMPKRVISLLAAFTTMLSERRDWSLADIGSGTGAAVVALQLLHPRIESNLLGVDASAEMSRFARRTQDQIRYPAQFTEGTIESLIDDPTMIESLNLVTFSAPFDRTFDRWLPLSKMFDRTAAQTVLAVEPESRAFLLNEFEAALRKRGWQTRRSTSSNIPTFMKEVRALPGLTRLWRQIGAPGSYQPQTWWEPPPDEYLLASRS